MLRDLLGISEIPKDIRDLHKARVTEKMNRLNAVRGLYILVLGVVIEIVLILFYDLPNISANGWVSNFGLYYLIVHSIILLVCILGSFRSYRIVSNKPLRLIKNIPFEYFATLVAFVFLAGMAAINAMDQRYTENITVYTIYVLIVGGIVMLEPKFMITAILTAHSIFVIGMVEFQTDASVLALNLTNGTIVVVCSLFINYIFYNNFYEMYLKSLLLEDTSKKLEVLSNTDPLTALYNRRYFYKYISDKDFINTTHGRIVFILFDLDSFKEVNDTYGHIVGDEVLLAFATILKNKISTHDISVRWGGEEFLLVLLGKTNEESLEISKQVLDECKTVYSTTLLHPIKVSASAGIACTEQYDYKEIDQILSKADTAMYLAKSRGKNQIAFYEKEKSI